MNKLCKEYIREVKAMFPVKGKKERKYIKELSKDIEDYCEESNATTKEELYENYGNPIDVVGEYLSATDFSGVIKRLKTGKYIKLLIAVIIAVVLVLTTMYCVILLEEHQMLVRQARFFAEM